MYQKSNLQCTVASAELFTQSDLFVTYHYILGIAELSTKRFVINVAELSTG